jgi:hypothetical protein
LFYLLAPFYWLSGGLSVGLHVGALAINAASIVGMAVFARRRGGAPLVLFTMLGCVVLMRTLGTEVLAAPWNTYITPLPFALMILLTWSLACGDRHALVPAVVVASFLAQTHVGFIAVALPLLIAGAVCLVGDVRRSGDALSRRALVRTGIVSAGVFGLLWLPPILDVVFNEPSNARRVFRWFRAADEGTQSLVVGWRVIVGQFGVPPEWMTGALPFSFPTGESPFIYRAPAPWLLVPLVIAVVALWRQGHEARRLGAVFGLTMAICVLAIARTVGPVYAYRLFWTWVPAMLALVLTLWAGWLAIRRRNGAWARSVLLGAAAVVAVVAGINVVRAGMADTPHPVDSETVATLLPDVVQIAEGADVPIVVEDPYAAGMWWARGLTLQLERRGIAVRVPATWSIALGEHRVVDADGPAPQRIVVATGDMIDDLAGPGMRVVAEWRARDPSPGSIGQERARRRAEIEADWRAGRVSAEEALTKLSALGADAPVGDMGVPRVAVLQEIGSPPRP